MITAPTIISDCYTVRAIREQDLPAILKIYNECILDHTTLLYYEPVDLRFIQKWYEKCRTEGYAAMAVVDKATDEAIAYADLGPTHPFPAFALSTMMAIYIRSDYRRRGLGRVLVAELLNIAKQQRFKNVVVYIASTNTPSIKLFESFKFQYVGKMDYWAYNFGRFLDGLAYQFIIPETKVDANTNSPPVFVPFAWESYVYAQQ
ncbi:acyl-CoA N-acyltransferase [Zychaea mexicana]|uniref:acyl-CoA N-acyltransferase n=1 Tax=Zychaea mexicana TaxID=64656 RepID=UPI0022FEF205|nr:acyl-CoA N-acyltransferase [Zychaea mexicana]KAI9496033.1 acyl-CoA N-acyltransferase [Zychaea mexicana]